MKRSDGAGSTVVQALYGMSDDRGPDTFIRLAGRGAGSLLVPALVASTLAKGRPTPIHGQPDQRRFWRLLGIPGPSRLYSGVGTISASIDATGSGSTAARLVDTAGDTAYRRRERTLSHHFKHLSLQAKSAVRSGMVFAEQKARMKLVLVARFLDGVFQPDRSINGVLGGLVAINGWV